jgi:hypothetical protein
MIVLTAFHPSSSCNLSVPQDLNRQTAVCGDDIGRRNKNMKHFNRTHVWMSSVLIGSLVTMLPVSGLARPVLYAIDNENPYINRVNPITGVEESYVQISVPGEQIVQGNGLAVSPVSNEIYAAVALDGHLRPGRNLIKINLGTGVATDVGPMEFGGMGQPIAGLAFDDNDMLYAVSGDCLNVNSCSGALAETLFTVNRNDASLTFFQTLGNGDDGEAIAFNPNDGMMYHMSGAGAGLILEKINLSNHAVTPIPMSGDSVGVFETIGFTFDATQNLFVGSLINCLCTPEDRSFFKLTSGGVLTHVNTLPHWWKDYAFYEVPGLDLASLPDVGDSGAADAAVLVERPAAAQAGMAKVAALDPGIHVFVRDGATGNGIAKKKVFNSSWRAIDLAATRNGVNSLVAVLAQKDDGTINVALHRAKNGKLVRKIAFFNANWVPAALVYVPRAEGSGKHAIAVVAKNRNDNRVSVQLRRLSDGSKINTTIFFKNNSNWQVIDLQTMADIDDNHRPEIIVLARSDSGKNVAVIRDAASQDLVNKITYFRDTVTPRAITPTSDIGGGSGPELSVLGAKANGQNVVQSRDAAADDLVSNVSMLNENWTSIDVGGLDEVNGNSSADLAVLAEHVASGAIRAQVRDGFSGDPIQTMTFLKTGWRAGAFAVFDDITGNGVQELGVVAQKSDGKVRVQIRDASTGLTVTTFDIQ